MSDDPRTIRVLVAHHEGLLRDAVAGALSCRARLEVVGRTADGQETVCRAERERPDVVVVADRMPGGGERWLLAALPRRAPGCRVVILGERPEGGPRTALDHGASSYVSMAAPFEDLVQAIHAAHRGERPPGG